MTELEPVCQSPDCRPVSPFQAFDLKEEQIVLWLHAGGTGRALSHAQEPANVVAQIGERLVVYVRLTLGSLPVPRFRDHG